MSASLGTHAATGIRAGTGAAAGLPRTDLAFADNAKAIGILLVVVGHAPGLTGMGDASIAAAIFAFHMPLFFFLSGFLVSPARRAESPGTRLRALLHDLGIPYLLFFALSWAYWLATRGIGPRAAKTAGIGWAEPLRGFVTGIGVDVLVNPTLWFFPCMIVVAMVWHVLQRAVGTKGALLATLVPALGTCAIAPWPWARLPFGVDIALVATVFYAAGAWLRERPTLWPQRPLSSGAAVALAAGCVLGVAAVTAANGQPDLNRMVLGNRPLLLLPGAATGIALVLLAARALPVTGAARWLASATLVIFPTHVLAFNLFSGLSKLVFKLSPQTMDGAAWWAAACVFALALAVPATWALRRWLPSVFGRRPLRVPAQALG